MVCPWREGGGEPRPLRAAIKTCGIGIVGGNVRGGGVNTTGWEGGDMSMSAMKWLRVTPGSCRGWLNIEVEQVGGRDLGGISASNIVRK